MEPVKDSGAVPEHSWSLESNGARQRVRMERYDFAAQVVGESGKKIQRGATPKGVIHRVKYVKMAQTESENIYVNVASAAKALQLPKLKLWLASRKKGGAEKLLLRQAETLKNYEDIFDILEAKNPQMAQKPYFRRSVMKTVKLGFKLTEKESTALISSERYFGTVHVEYLTAEKQVAFSVIGRKMGEGGFREVYELIRATGKEVHEGQKSVLIQAKKEGSGAEESTLKEAKISKYLNKAGPHEGIPRPIEARQIAVQTITRKQRKPQETPKRVFAKMEYMAGGDMSAKSLNRSSFSSLPMKQRLELCRQLVSGLAFMHEKGFVHGDIKPANFLMNDKENPTMAQISDLGGGCLIAANPTASPEDYTSSFRLKNDHIYAFYAMTLTKNGDVEEIRNDTQLKPEERKGKLEKVEKEWRQDRKIAFEKMDVFSMGKSLAEMLMGPEVSRNRGHENYPFRYEPHLTTRGNQTRSIEQVGGVDPDKLRLVIKNNLTGVDEAAVDALNDLLIKAMDPKIQTRLSAAQLLEGLDAIIQKIRD